MGCANGQQRRRPLGMGDINRSRRKSVSRQGNSMPWDTAGASAVCTQQAARGGRVMGYRREDPAGGW